MIARLRMSDNEVVVAKRNAALADHDRIGASSSIPGLGDHVAHVARREKLPLLDIHRLAGSRNGLDEVGLATEKGRRLQHIDDGSHGGDVLLAMHVGQHRDTDLAPHLRENLQTAVDARPARRAPRAAVGLVVGGLEDVRQTQTSTDFLHLRGDLDAQLERLGGARTGDQEQRLVDAGVEMQSFMPSPGTPRPPQQRK
jgi:hypothetical protein